MFLCVHVCVTQVGQNFIPSSVPNTFAPSPTPAVLSSGLNDLFELSTGMAITTGGYVTPKSVSTHSSMLMLMFNANAIQSLMLMLALCWDKVDVHC